LTRLLTGIKATQALAAATPDVKQEEKTTASAGSTSTGPAWKKAQDVEESEGIIHIFFLGVFLFRSYL